MVAQRWIFDDDAENMEQLSTAFASSYQVTSERDPDQAMTVAQGGQFDLIIVSLVIDGNDGLRLCSHLRMMELGAFGHQPSCRALSLSLSLSLTLPL